MNHGLLNYLHELAFFEDQNGELGRQHDFVASHGVATVLAALKFSLYQRNIANPGGYLRNLVEGGEAGCLHPFIRQRLRGYVQRFEQWLCVEEAVLLLRWAAQKGPTKPNSGLRKEERAPRVARERRPKGDELNSTGCDCHDSANEAYFRDHADELARGGIGRVPSASSDKVVAEREGKLEEKVR